MGTDGKGSPSGGNRKPKEGTKGALGVPSIPPACNWCAPSIPLDGQ